MKIEKVFYVGTNPYSYRSGEYAEVVDVVSVRPDEVSSFRPCFYIKFADGKTDYCPVSDYANYELCTESDIRTQYSKR